MAEPTTTENNPTSAASVNTTPAPATPVTPAVDTGATAAKPDSTATSATASTDLSKLPPVTLDDFDKEMDGGNTRVAPKAAIDPNDVNKPKVDPAIKTTGAATKVDPKIADSATATVATPKTDEPEAPDAGSRDYSGLEDNEVPLFRRMSNAAFNALKPQLLELKTKRVAIQKMETEVAQLRQGKVTIPDNYVEHPEAYLLVPEAKECISAINTYQQFQQHWEQQLLNIKNGKEWKDLVRNADGSYSVAAAGSAPTPESDIAVSRWLNGTSLKIGEFQGRLQALQQNHVGRHQQDVGVVKGASKEYFGYLDDEKHPARATYNQILQKFPASFRGHPLADLAARATTAALQLQQAMKMLEAGKTTATTTAAAIADDARRAGPTAAAINSGGGAVAKKSVTLGDFEKEMQ